VNYHQLTQVAYTSFSWCCPASSLPWCSMYLRMMSSFTPTVETK